MNKFLAVVVLFFSMIGFANASDPAHWTCVSNDASNTRFFVIINDLNYIMFENDGTYLGRGTFDVGKLDDGKKFVSAVVVTKRGPFVFTAASLDNGKMFALVTFASEKQSQFVCE